MNHIVGKFFHIMENEDNNKIRFQGGVKQYLNDNYYLVQFYSFLDGTETYQKVFHIAHMVYWRFYESNENWTNAFNKSNKEDKK